MDKEIAPFYVGQKVVAVDAMPMSHFKNGQIYTVASIEYRLGNPNHPIGRITYYWYVGIVGHENGGAYFRPAIFAPIEESFITISLKEITEIETKLIAAN